MNKLPITLERLIDAWCCKCQKPTDKVLRLTYEYEAADRFVVQCHGEQQEQDLSLEIKLCATSIRIEAFRDVPQIEHQKFLPDDTAGEQ